VDVSEVSQAQRRERRVLWTGGWDSSFRVLQLLFDTDHVVAPVYFVNPQRRSLLHEVRAMDTISARARRRRPDFEARLLPTQYIEMERVPVDPDVTAALQRCKARGFIGPQYDYLARYLRWVPEAGPLELCIERDSRPHVLMKSVLVPAGEHQVYQLRADQREQDLGVLFRDMEFPLLEYSKQAMREQAERSGYLDILDKSWFCQYPIGASPCGRCSPCEQVVKAGFTHRLSRRARLRYQLSLQRRLREWRREHDPASAS